MEEATKTPPWKTKKKTKDKDETGLNKTKAHEIIPSPVIQRKEEEGNMGSSTKTHNSRKK